MEAAHASGRGRRHWAGQAARALVAMVSGLVVCSVLTGAASAPGGHGSAVRAAAFSRLFGVSCASASDCWAVGRHDDTSTRTFRLVEHWNGTSWRIVNVPSPPGARWSLLSGVSCPGVTDCWAVGGYSPHFNAVPAFAYAEHWNGKQWSVVTLPNPPGGVSGGLGRVSCLSARSCWAVGAAADGPPGASGLIEHWNGHAWSIVPGPKAGGVTGVSCISGNDCWAVGGSGSGTLTERWNGSSWQSFALPRPRDALFSKAFYVSCLTAGDCWAVGDQFKTSHADLALFEHWNGRKWSVVGG